MDRWLLIPSIDQMRLNEALIVGGMVTKKEIVNQALKEFIQRREQKRLVELFGSLPADDDYKKGRE